MIIDSSHLIYFSPTHTSKQVAEAIVEGTNIKDVFSVDLTLHPSEDKMISSSSLAVFAIPVYGGHIAPLAAERLKSVKGMATPAIVTVVYGNRDYEKALDELASLVASLGFEVIAGATFIGEHSYSTEQHPIAAGRPDQSDLKFAAGFGKRIMEKVRSAETVSELKVNVCEIARPEQSASSVQRFVEQVMKLRKEATAPLPSAPWIEDESLCAHCGECAAHCPAGAIVAGDELHTDAEKCIRCCACVKLCPSGARGYDTPFGTLLSECFSERKSPQTIL